MNNNPEFVQSAIDLIVDHPEFNKEKFLKTNPKLKEVVEKAIKEKNMKNKIKITQHIPNYCSGCEGKIAEFSNPEEFKKIEWLKHWYEEENFYRFSVSENRLMVELNEGYDWWVIGYMDKSAEWLPKWVAKYKKS